MRKLEKAACYIPLTRFLRKVIYELHYTTVRIETLEIFRLRQLPVCDVYRSIGDGPDYEFLDKLLEDFNAIR